MKVLKFGGSSVGTPDRIRSVKKIIDSQPVPSVIVVSAFQDVTDQLHKTAELAAAGDNEYKNTFNKIVDKHNEFTLKLIPDKVRQQEVLETIGAVSGELGEILKGISILREMTRHSYDQVITAGERLSSFIMWNLIEDSLYIDSRELIKTVERSGRHEVDFAMTNSLIRDKIGKPERNIIVAGFIATGTKGETTSLGRGGSDYTASIIAASLKAESLEIWTDVDGFMTADPRKVEKAYTIESLTYAEAMELSHFGAKVIYTPTLRPVYRENIPVTVKNSLNPGHSGTLISHNATDQGRSPIKGISSIDHIDLVTLQGPAMVGVTGTSARLFSALAKQGINIILITQASSEFSITFAVTPDSSNAAIEAIREEFKNEIEKNEELRIIVEKNLSIIAIVGERMKNTPGISATLFRALGRNGINVVATAQGSSELNISVVIKHESLKKALNVIHDGFFLSTLKEVNLFIAGTGIVGSTLLKQLQKQQDLLLKNHSLKVNLLGLTNSRKMFIDTKGIPWQSCNEVLKAVEGKADITLFIREMKKMNLRNSVFIDCTADAGIALKYTDILESYISVITANKIACSSEFSYYQQLKTISSERGVRFMFETTVGAGLPVIKTISDLVLSGDKIYRIEAVLSGTLNYIFNEICEKVPLSQAIRQAKDKGYSEPDPRIDLDGTDVARKILILAREAGYNIEKEEVEITRFLPDECFEGDINDFYRKVQKYDNEFEKQRIELVSQGKKWRFLAVLDQGKASVKLVSVDKDHPSYNLEGSNNIVLLTTERYRELPMVIKGYGAGAEVTAAGVFADLMRVVNV
jgi:bifunctional aspartokinase / homoserine dehydrogenase 1